MRTKAILGLGMAVGLAACATEQPTRDCSIWEEVYVWADHDGDGFGTDEPLGYTCEPQANEATNNVDCDDEDAVIFPNAEEICDDKDNNCNDTIDEDNPKVPYYFDSDGDLFGDPLLFEVACIAPSGYVTQATDCDDANALINPGMREVCNEWDDDCDELADDADPSVDPTTAVRYYFDQDGDGHGQAVVYVDQCDPPATGSLLNDDCNDANSAVSPTAPELCNRKDDDCDLLVDEADPSIAHENQTGYFLDVDGDTFGDPATGVWTCDRSPEPVVLGYAVFDGTDCDDTDPDEHLLQDWYADADIDGYGGGMKVVTSCGYPGGGLVPGDPGLDCNDFEPNENPGLIEICNDGYDNDCSGLDTCRSCQDWLESDPAFTDGVYTVSPTDGAGDYDVYCDMTTDGGGWTLVASTALTTLDDAASDYYDDLTTIEPVKGNAGVWDGMRDFVGQVGDIRFACKELASNPTWDMDISFYANKWYWEITTGSDAASCFNEDDGAGDDPPPERTDNVSGEHLAAGSIWRTSGYLEGEDSCSDDLDFTIDWDDRGMKSNPNDGTDWGEANGMGKCASTLAGGEVWVIFARE